MVSSRIDTSQIQQHYDQISPLYKLFWGNHIHHGYWDSRESRSVAQVRLIEELAAFAGLRSGSRVLDVGCGLGGSAQWLARNRDCTVLGLTLSPVQAKMARASIHRSGLRNRVRIEVQDANSLPLAERFDAVWVIECSEHLHDKPAFLRTVRSLLHPGGTVALCAWLVAERLITPADRELATGICDAMLCPSLASMEEYREWMREAGFVQIQSKDITRRVEQTWDLCSKIAGRPAVRVLLRSADRQTRDFVAAFESIRRAYATGVMRYGMFAGHAVVS